MSLLFPAILLGVGLIAAGIAYWTDSEFRGAGFAAGLFLTMLLGPLACVVYGAYAWLRIGTWQSISIEDTLMFLIKNGIDVGFFFEPVSWQGVQRLSEWYLASNIGWSLFAICMALLWFWLHMSERDQRRNKK